MNTVADPDDVRRFHKAHMNPTLDKLFGALGFGRVFVKAEGNYVYDDEGNEILDALSGFGTMNVGHNHPRLRARLTRVLDDAPLHFSHTGPPAYAATLAAELARRVPDLSRVLFSSSGSEAVDAALKLARAATGRTMFVFAQGGYHGTSLGPLSVMGDKRMRAPFGALLDAQSVPFGDVDALQVVLKSRTAACFIVEPILGEGGVVMPPDGYLHAASALCKKYGTLFVLDEVQTGLGRTGAFLARDLISPLPADIICLGKALSGGIVPIAATLCSPQVHDRAYGHKDRFDLHSYTFEGGALAASAALETLAVLDDEGLVERSRALGTTLKAKLIEKLGTHPMVREIRGQGLLIGIDLGPPDDTLWQKLTAGVKTRLSQEVVGQWLCLQLLERGVLAQPASHAWNVLRLEPPLTLTDGQADQLVDALAAVFGQFESYAHILAETTKRFSSQWRAGWAY